MEEIRPLRVIKGKTPRFGNPNLCLNRIPAVNIM
jgi:hypothetical protein